MRLKALEITMGPFDVSVGIIISKRFTINSQQMNDMNEYMQHIPVLLVINNQLNVMSPVVVPSCLQRHDP